MGLFRPARDRRGPDPYYKWKAILFSIGACIALAGMLTEHDWLVLVAIPVLGLGVALRFLDRRDAGADEDREQDDRSDREGRPGPD